MQPIHKREFSAFCCTIEKALEVFVAKGVVEDVADPVDVAVGDGLEDVEAEELLERDVYRVRRK